jgi:hypothetical protein
MDIQNSLNKIEQYWQIIRNLHFHIQEEGKISDEEYALIKKYLEVITEKYASLVVDTPKVTPIIKEEVQQQIPTNLVSENIIQEEISIVKTIEPEPIAITTPTPDPLKDLRVQPAKDNTVSSMLEKMLEGKQEVGVQLPKIKIDEPAKNPTQSVNTPSINDRLKANTTGKEELNVRIKKSVADTISLNDKFEFIRELFANNTVEYATALQKIDDFKTLEGALAYFDDHYGSKFQWDKKESTAEKFKGIIRQRY